MKMKQKLTFGSFSLNLSSRGSNLEIVECQEFVWACLAEQECYRFRIRYATSKYEHFKDSHTFIPPRGKCLYLVPHRDGILLQVLSTWIAS